MATTHDIAILSIVQNHREELMNVSIRKLCGHLNRLSDRCATWDSGQGSHHSHSGLGACCWTETFGDDTGRVGAEPASGLLSCKGVFPIAQGENGFRTEGRAVAYDGCKTACGAVLILSQIVSRAARKPRTPGLFYGQAGQAAAPEGAFRQAHKEITPWKGRRTQQ
jgi:uncharacterized Zn-binding protein involved in type VI secretion